MPKAENIKMLREKNFVAVVSLPGSSSGMSFTLLTFSAGAPDKVLSVWDTKTFEIICAFVAVYFSPGS